MNFKKFGRTAQLFDYQTGTPTPYKYLDENGNENEVAEIAPWYITDYIPIPDGVLSVTLSKIGGGSPAMCAYDASKNYITGIKYNTGSAVTKVDITLTSSTPIRFIRFSYFLGNTGYDDISTKMLNEGSTALPYQPYKDWTGTPYYLHTTATDTITTLPADIYADGTNATVGLVGNMQQTDTPTPQNPIQPSETGERTGNLFDYTKTDGIIANKYINQRGNMVTDNEYYLSYPIKVNVGGTYTWRFNSNEGTGHTAPTVGFYDSSDNLLSTAQHDLTIQYFSFEVPANCAYIRASVFTRSNAQKEAMLNTGSSPLPYEPYGYKLDIKSANTTTPVYLGEVESTRKIKKLVLTGEETYTADAPYSRFITAFPNAKIEGLRLTQVFCTHFISVYDGRPISEVPNNSIYSSDVSADRFFIKTTDYTTAAAFKAYLAAQYANGTPVTVWYVLATPETSTVNEPLRKIGDYADTVSGITIPTIAGANSFDVLTTLKPSEVDLTYHGWHDASAKEWDGSEWQ